jgi:hypothetical protein
MGRIKAVGFARNVLFPNRLQRKTGVVNVPAIASHVSKRAHGTVRGASFDIVPGTEHKNIASNRD